MIYLVSLSKDWLLMRLQHQAIHITITNGDKSAMVNDFGGVTKIFCAQGPPLYIT